MDNVYIKSTGFTQTQVNDDVNATNWNANYDGNTAKLSMNINNNGFNEHIKMLMTNEELMKLVNVPTIQGDIDERLQNTFLKNHIPCKYKNNNKLLSQTRYLNDDEEENDEEENDEEEDHNEFIDDEYEEEDRLNDRLREEDFYEKQKQITYPITKLSSLPLKTKSRTKQLKEILSHTPSSNRSLKRSLPTLTSSKFVISPDDLRDSLEPVTKQHFRTSLSLRGGKKTKKTKKTKKRKSTRISTFLHRLKFV
jgi:hypothetical protein